MARGLDLSCKALPLRTKRAWRIFWALVLLVLSFFVVERTFQNDTFYVIKMGEAVLDYGVDFKDHWAWSAQIGYNYPHIIYNVLIALTYRVSGFFGVYVSVIVCAYVLAMSTYYLLERIYIEVAEKNCPQLYPLVGMIVGVVILLNYKYYLIARPQAVSYILWLWETWLINRLLNTGKIRYGAGIFGLAVLCANIHATAWYFTFILFLPFFGSIYLTRFCRYLSGKGIRAPYCRIEELIIPADNNELSNVRKLWLVMVCSFASGLLSPARICYTSVFKATSSRTTEYITEHKPLVLADMKYVLISLILFIVLVSLCRVKCRLDLLLLFCGTFVMAVAARRHVGLFVYIGWLGFYYLIFSLLCKLPSGSIDRVRKSVIPLLLTAALLVGGFLQFNAPFYGYKDPYYASDEAIDFLKENYDLSELRIYNEYEYGAYMMFMDVPVFIDSRVNEYTKAFSPELERDVLNDYVTIWRLDDGWLDVIDYYDFDGYYIPKNCALYQALMLMPDVETVWENDNDNMVILMTVR